MCTWQAGYWCIGGMLGRRYQTKAVHVKMLILVGFAVSVEVTAQQPVQASQTFYRHVEDDTLWKMYSTHCLRNITHKERYNSA